ncbi:MAG: histidine phosphatase family protein [Hyphomicrobiaceae bacterium]
MLTLSILRHAKAGTERPGESDHDRPLAPRGRRAAPLMGHFIAEHHLEPDVVLCSTATRTRQTLDLISAEFVSEPRIVFDEALYLAEPEDILGVLRTRSGLVKRVMIVGHNPGLQELVLMLAGAGRKGDLALIRSKFPTAGLAVLNFTQTDWSSVGPRTGVLRLYMSPRRLP